MSRNVTNFGFFSSASLSFSSRGEPLRLTLACLFSWSNLTMMYSIYGQKVRIDYMGINVCFGIFYF